MKSLLVCLFAVVLLSQAVESLRCYNCPRGGASCVGTETCAPNQDRCLTMIFNNPPSIRPTYAKRCGKQYECELLKPVAVVSCCATDLCNR